MRTPARRYGGTLRVAGALLDSLHHRHTRLAEATRRDLDVCLGPDLLEAGVDRASFVSFALLAEGVGKAVEAPAVVGEFLQVGAVDLFGFGKLAGLHQGGAKGVTGRDHPCR